MSLKSLLRKLLPIWFRRIRGIYICHKNALEVHQNMQSIGEELKDELQTVLTTVPHRLDLIAKLSQEAVIAEIGVEHGNFSEKILNICKPKKLHLIDLWAPETNADRPHVEMRFKNQIRNGIVSLHQGYSWDMLATFPDETFDWVYIDAGHDYDSVTKDLEMCKHKVKKNGYICGHDYVLWSGNGLYRFGVVEAVNAFCNGNNYEMVYISNEKDRHLSYAIRLTSPI